MRNISFLKKFLKTQHTTLKCLFIVEKKKNNSTGIIVHPYYELFRKLNAKRNNGEKQDRKRKLLPIIPFEVILCNLVPFLDAKSLCTISGI